MVGRNLFLGLAAAFVSALFLFGMPEQAQAQCCAPPPPPCCHAPNPPPPACCHVPSPPPQNPVCCVPGHNVNIPGVNVFVGANVIVNAQVNAQASATSQAGGQGQVIVMGGGGGGGGVIAPSGGVIQGLNVEGGIRRVSYEALRVRTRRVVIQAFCFDDLNNPHPASQVTPDREIGDNYDGELWRCIAGTHLQLTWVEWRAGRVDFSGGETMTCRRGEALYHAPFRGARDGDLEEGQSPPPPAFECRPQRPARDCNERSLLRRFGAGVKILTMIRVERYQAFREEHYQSASSSSTAFSMDGGVGGVAY